MTASGSPIRLSLTATAETRNLPEGLPVCRHADWHDAHNFPGEEMTRSFLNLLCSTCILLGAAAPSPLHAADDSASPRDTAIDLSPYAGKVVYLDFWASWCGPCKQSFPWMMGLAKRHGEAGLVVLTVNVEPDRKAADAFLERMKSTLPVVYDPEGKIAAAFELEAMPSSFVYGRDGTLRASHLGFHLDQEQKIEAEIEKLLGEKARPDEEKHESGH